MEPEGSLPHSQEPATWRGVDIYLHSFLTSKLARGERSISRLCRLTPGNEPRTHFRGGLVDPKTGLNLLEKGRTCFPYRDLNFGRPFRSYTGDAYPTSDRQAYMAQNR
jgi:hypothetical protein